MARVEPLKREDLKDFEAFFERVEASMGFVPSSMFNMARKPELLKAMGGMFAAVFATGEAPPQLKQMCAYMCSVGAGCRYCQAHTATHAEHMGVGAEKIDALSDFETSPLFTDSERAALRLALSAGKTPSETTDEHFAELRKHFNENQIVDLVSTIAMFGFLNRWNDTLATDLEACPLEFAEAHLAPQGWEGGKHVAGARG